MLQVKYLLNDVCFQEDKTVSQMKLINLEFYVWKVFFKPLLILVLFVFLYLYHNFLKQNLHIVKQTIHHVFYVSAIHFLLTNCHRFGVFADLFIDLNLVFNLLSLLFFFCLWLFFLSSFRFVTFLSCDNDLKPFDWYFNGFGDDFRQWYWDW